MISYLLFHYIFDGFSFLLPTFSILFHFALLFQNFSPFFLCFPLNGELTSTFHFLQTCSLFIGLFLLLNQQKKNNQLRYYKPAIVFFYTFLAATAAI